MRTFNNIQTELTEELLKKLPREEREDLLEYIDSIQFIQNLASIDRKYSKDLPRWDNPLLPITSDDPDMSVRTLDPKGLIAVDLTNPHILTDMDYFRPSAIHFEKHGVYTRLYPNKNPNSDYFKFWKEEARRCREGFIREYDGEWIPGNYYFQLNYAPLLRAEVVEGTKMADRVENFAYVYDADYWFFHYVEQCKARGMHGANLKRRGCGYSVKASNMLARNFILGNSEKSKIKVKSFAIANEKEYLTKDGVLNKFVGVADFCAKHTAFPKIRSLKDSFNDMHWRMGFKDNSTGTEKGTLNEVMGVTLKNDPQKAHPYNMNIPTPSGIKKWEEIKIGDKLFNTYGGLTTVTEVHEFGLGDVYEIRFSDGRKVQCSGAHEWNVFRQCGTKRISKRMETLDIIERLNYQNSSKAAKISIEVNTSVCNFDAKEVPMDAYTLGLMLGDGSMGKSSNNLSYLTMMWDDVDSIKKFIPYNVLRENHGGAIRNKIEIPNGKSIYKSLDLYDKRSESKFIPDVYKYNTEEIRLGIVNGLLDTDGSCTKDYGVIEYSTKSERMADDFMEIIYSLGIGGRKSFKIIKGIKYYRCYVYCTPEENRLFNLKRKKDLIRNKKNSSYSKYKRYYTTIESVIKLDNRENLKCVTVDSKDTMYLCDNFLPTFNSRGKRGALVIWEEAGKFSEFLTAWGIARPSVEESGYAFGFMIAAGTGGVEGADFKGLEEIFYNSGGHNIYSVPNVFDKNTFGKGECAFFFATYLNYKGKMDLNGNSDVIGALIQINKERSKVKYGSSDPNAIVQKKAEEPITPQEAIMRTEGSAFPTGDLRDYLDEIMPNIERFTNEHYIGRLAYNDKGEVEWKHDQSLLPIREFPYKVKGGKSDGAIEIFDMPQKDREGRVFSGRYIGGIDPVDNDYTVSGSLASIFIFDLWTDKIVAEYTARPVLADDFYETCLRLLSFYNAQGNYENNLKGLFSYFSNHNGLHLLCETPGILRDMDIVKSILHGNRSTGTRTTKEVIKLGKTLQRQWMLSNYEIETFNEEDKETVTSNILNLRRIRSIGYIKECIAWNPDINTDRISAMDMVMILREDRAKMTTKYEEKEDNINNFNTGDSFLDANWEKAMNKMSNNKNMF